MDKYIHIVALDVPYPVDYGGVFDLFYKLVALKECGIQIHLHCFEYGRGEQPELNKYCASVNYYPRRCGHKGISNELPYIVASRISEELSDNLLKDGHPILLEGIHCSALLQDPRFRDRQILLRLHNVEYHYYRQLLGNSGSLFKKIYYWHESRLLRKYESSVAHQVMIAGVSEKDVMTYRREFGTTNIVHLPVFLPFQKVESPEGMGCFCLYHGNLSVAENEQAALWLLQKVFNRMEAPFVIAGKNPSRRLEKLVEKHPHTCLVANPSEEEMQDMIRKAQIHLLPSFNCTGIKLKLLNALYNGRHCVVNDAMVEGTGLEPACHIGEGAEAFRQLVAQLYHRPFTEEEVRLRKFLLESTFDNRANAQRLIQWIS